jgi:hypothetical protein
LKSLSAKSSGAQIQRRFHMLLLLKIGEAKSRSRAVRQLSACRHSVADWLEPCEEGGLEGIQEIGEFFGLPDESKRAVLQQWSQYPIHWSTILCAKCPCFSQLIWLC